MNLHLLYSFVIFGKLYFDKEHLNGFNGAIYFTRHADQKESVLTCLELKGSGYARLSYDYHANVIYQ